MLEDKESKDIRDYKPFAEGKNVRVNFEGLAVCDFDDNTEGNLNHQLHFLRHPEHHNLKVSIIKIPLDGEPSIILDTTNVPETTKPISISADNSIVPAFGYLHFPEENEYPLPGRILNFNELHRDRFTVFGNEAIKPPTDVLLENFAFYTSEITMLGIKYRVDVELLNKKQNFELGKVFSGYMQSIGGELDIDIPGIELEDEGYYEIEDNKFEISFSNHCYEIPEVCNAGMGEYDSDVEFLYDILKPDVANANRTKLQPFVTNVEENIVKAKVEDGKVISFAKLELGDGEEFRPSPEIAACGPTQINP